MTKVRYADTRREIGLTRLGASATRSRRRIPGMDPRGSRASQRMRRRRQRRWTGLGVLGLLVAVGFGLFSLKVGRVQVLGAVVADQAALKTILAPQLGARLALIDVSQLRRELLADPWIKRVGIRRWIDGSLRVRVEEACPAFLLADGSGAICRDGSFLPLREGLDLTGLPRLDAPRSGEGAQLRRDAVVAVRRLTRALDRTPWTWPNGLQAVEFDDGGAVVITTGSGVAVALGDRDWSRRMMAMAATFPVLRPGPGDRLDLRFERQVVLQPAAVVGDRIGG